MIKPPLLALVWQMIPGVLVGLVLALLAAFGAQVWFRPDVLAAIVLLAMVLGFLRWWRVQFEVDAHGQVVYLHGNQWPLAELDALIRPLTSAGAKVTVLAEPSRVRDLPEKYRRILPWGSRHPGLLVALVLVVALIFVVTMGVASL